MKKTYFSAGIVCVLCGLFFFVVPPVFSAAIQITYPQPESPTDKRAEYFVKLLDLALSKTDSTYELHPYRQRMAQARALNQLEMGEGVDVVWSMTSRDREKISLPIRIPIDKGLFGWRLLLINKRDHERFKNLQSLADLRAYSAGQGHDWPDTMILRANGINVITGSNYEALFKMLQAGRFQYFPRSMLEIWDEEKNHPDVNLEIEQNIVLYYPTCLYFFVNKRNLILSDLIERGLHIAMKDGSFDRLFDAYYGDFIKLTNLRSRRIVELNNPLLPDETPLNQSEFWFNPQTLPKVH